MKRFGAILFWVGVLLMVASAAVGTFSGFRAAGALQTAVDEAVPMPGGSSTLQLEAGDQRTIYEQSESGVPRASCAASGPDNVAVVIDRDTEQSGSLGDLSYTNVGSITATEAGTYTVTCTGAITLIGPSLDLETVGLGALGVLGGILGAGLGLMLAIVGAVMWFIGRSRTAAAGTATYPGSARPPPGPSGSPPPPASGGSYPPPPPPPSS